MMQQPSTPASRNDLRRYARIARHSLWLLIACPLIAALTAGAVSSQLAPVYEAHVSLLVRPAQVLPVDTAGGAGAYMTSDQISRTYAQLMVQRPLLEQVNHELNLGTTPEQLGKKIRVTPQPNTTILDVAVDDTSPERASTIANTVSNDFIAQIKQIQQQEVTSQNTRAQDNLVVTSPAVPPDTPVSPKIPLNIAIAFAAGLLVAVGVVLLREYLDQTVKSDDDLADRTGLAAIAHVPFTPTAAGRRGELVMLQGESPAAEAYRALRTNLLFSAVDRESKVLVITSAGPGEGKSRTASNLAAALGQAGYRTLLIDCDFRRPSLHRIMGRVRNVGMSNLTIQDLPEDQLILDVEGVPNLKLIPSGPTPPNPSELLGSGRMRSLLDRFREQYHYVVIDTPPANLVTDASVLATVADAVLLVADSGRTTYPAVAHAKDSIERVGGHIVGAVINKVRTDGAHAYYGGYHYGGYGTGPAKPSPRTGSRRSELDPARDIKSFP